MIDFVKSNKAIEEVVAFQKYRIIIKITHLMNIHVDTIIAGTPQEIYSKKTLILFSSVIRDICKIKNKFVVEKDI